MIKVRIQAKEIHTNKILEWVTKEIYGYTPEGEASFDAFKWGWLQLQFLILIWLLKNTRKNVNV